MQFNSLKQDQQTTRMPDGTVIKVQRVFGQDTVDIIVPVSKITKEEISKKELSDFYYILKIINKTTTEPISIDQLSRLTFYSEGATNLTDIEHIVFDYHVPVDTDPEIYFGSVDNPGLEWDDETDCFCADISLFTDYLAELAAAGELKYFMVYSCVGNIEDVDQFTTMTQSQQYEEISEETDRWKEENLIPPNIFSENNIDYYEDSMRCNYESFILLKVGDFVTAFDAVHKGLAENIYNNDGDLVEWPEVFANISNWLSELTSEGSGTLGGTLSPCSNLAVPASCDPSGYDSAPAIYRDETDTYACTYSIEDADNRTTIESSADVVIWTYVEGGCNIVLTTSWLTYSEWFWYNGVRVVMANEVVADNSTYKTRDWSPPHNGEIDSYSYRTGAIWTPWGYCFKDFVTYNEHLIGVQTSVYGYSYSASTLTRARNAHRNIKIGRLVSNNVVFCFAGGSVRLWDYWDMNIYGNYTQDAFNSIHYDAVGVIGYFSDDDFSGIDITALDGVGIVGTAISELFQVYSEDCFDTNGYYPSGFWVTSMNLYRYSWTV
jgi:hypothetical protein